MPISRSAPRTRLSRRAFVRLAASAAAAVGSATFVEVALRTSGARAGSGQATPAGAVAPLLADIPAISDQARKYTHAANPYNNYEIFVPPSSWTQAQIQSAYPQEELDTANWSDATYLSAYNVAAATGYTQIFNILQTMRKYQRAFLISDRFVYAERVVPQWEYHGASDHPERQFGAFTAKYKSSGSGKQSVAELNIRYDAEKDNDADALLTQLNRAYFGDMTEMIRSNVNARPDPFDPLSTNGFLGSPVSNVMMEESEYQRSFTAYDAIMPFIQNGTLNLSANMAPDYRNLWAEFRYNQQTCSRRKPAATPR